MMRLLLLLVTLLQCGVLTAATYTVNVFDADLPAANPGFANCDADLVTAGDQCTLRAAVMKANEGPGMDTIVVPLDVALDLTIMGAGGAQQGDLDVTSPMIVTGILLGVPADITRLPNIGADHGQRIFDVHSGGDLQLAGLQLTGGDDFSGGAVRVLTNGVLSVDTVGFSFNQAQVGGVIQNSGEAIIERSRFLFSESNGAGSVIRNLNELTLRNSLITQSQNTGLTLGSIFAEPGSITRLENLTWDGTSGGGADAEQVAVAADLPAELTIRNSVVHNAPGTAVDVSASDGASTLRIYNNILHGSGVSDCQITTAAGDPADVSIRFNLIEQSDCNAFYDPFLDGVIEGQGPLLQLAPAMPATLFQPFLPRFNSPAVDAGFPSNQIPGNPDEPCVPVDVLGVMRPIDGDDDGTARCDMGTTERGELLSSTYVVNVYTQDAVDVFPGDDACDIDIVTPGSQCTLRAAVMEANAKAGPDRIQFINDVDSNTVNLTIAGVGNASVGDLDIFEQLTINGIAIGGRPITTITTAIGQRLFNVVLPPQQIAAFEELRLQGGHTTQSGGAIRAGADDIVIIRDSMVFGNSADSVGGAVSVGAGELYIRGSDFFGNTAAFGGGAIYVSNGTLVLQRSSVWDNTNTAMSAMDVVRVEGAGASLVANNSTVHANTGGLHFEGSGLLDLHAMTITANEQHGVRAIEVGDSLEVDIATSILAQNGGTDCMVTATGIVDLDNFNLIEDGSCPGGANNIAVDPVLAPELTRIDGEVSRVRRPLFSSPVLDAIPGVNSALCFGADQHFSPRPQDSDGDGHVDCEIGSLEMSRAQVLATRDLTVNQFDADLDDLAPGDTRCDVSFTNGDQCTLRAAVMESNALPITNTIEFSGQAPTILIDQPDAGGLNDPSHGDLDVLGRVLIFGNASDPGSRPHIQAVSGARVFNVNAPGDSVTFSGLRISGGNTTGSGGAVRVVAADSVSMDHMQFFDNTAGQGGGALSALAGSVIVSESDFFNNASLGSGAAIRSDAELTLSQSSVRENIDFDPLADREAIAGVAGALVQIRNSTVSGNNGAGVRIEDGTLSLENSTVAENDGAGVAFVEVAGETLFIRNTVLADNADGGCETTGGGAAVISTDGHNLTQSFGCEIEQGGSNIVSSVAGLGPLQMGSGDHSAYHVPEIGSPVLDTGHPVVGGVGCLEFDQLGVARPVDGDDDAVPRCDIGAIEAVIDFGLIFNDSFETP